MSLIELLEKGLIKKHSAEELAMLISTEFITVPAMKLTIKDLEAISNCETNTERASFLILKGIPNEVAINWVNYNYPKDIITGSSSF